MMAGIFGHVKFVTVMTLRAATVALSTTAMATAVRGTAQIQTRCARWRFALSRVHDDRAGR
jgi:hypothetical protein